MSRELTNRIPFLKERAHMFEKVRSFFSKRNVIEVDVPLLTQKAPIDAHIDLIKANCMGRTSFLQSSPEYGMKRLIADGLGDIYQMSHVYRNHEKGDRHNPEFVMVEWYRVGFSFSQMIEETLDFLNLFLPGQNVEHFTYDEIFSKYAQGLPETDLDFALNVEPFLGKNGFTVVSDFPPDQAALAETVERSGKKVALRFEIFFQGYELANGYKELTDAVEQKKRLLEANEKRRQLKKEEYPIDDRFLAALEKGLPSMCGVAVGFDRLMMLRCKTTNINDVIPFGWDET